MSVYLRTIVDGSYLKPVHCFNFEACKEQGEAASDQGFRRDQNPYPENTGEHRSWNYGWDNSMTELIG